jgi:hypothetical protein
MLCIWGKTYFFERNISWRCLSSILIVIIIISFCNFLSIRYRNRRTGYWCMNPLRQYNKTSTTQPWCINSFQVYTFISILIVCYLQVILSNKWYTILRCRIKLLERILKEPISWLRREYFSNFWKIIHFT